nr:hypothetical protein [Pseudoxanthomonas sp.]
MIVVVAALGLVGFGGKSKPAIKMLTSVQIEYVDEPMGAMQLPADTVRVPDSQLIVAGDHYSAGSVLVGGLLGALIDTARSNVASKRLLKNNPEVALHFQLNDRAREITQTRLAQMSPGSVNTFAPDGASRLQVWVTVILNFTHDQAYARPYVWLKAGLVPAGIHHATWQTNYFASWGPARPMEGDGGWSADGGAELRRTVDLALQEAIHVMLADVSQPFPRDPSTLQIIKMDYPYDREAMNSKVYRLGEDEKFVYFMPKVGDTWGKAGVHAVDRYMLEYYTRTGRFAPKAGEGEVP